MTRASDWTEPSPTNSLWEQVERSAAIAPESVLARDETGRTMSVGEYHRSCLALAGDLVARGVRAGDVVSWQLPTWFEAMVVAGALDAIGAVQNPLLPTLRRREVEFITVQAHSRWYLHPGVWRGHDYSAMVDALIDDAAPGMRSVCLERGTLFDGPPARPVTDRSEVRWLFYTSGTTGSPKGVRHGHRAVELATLTMCRSLRVEHHDCSVVAFPFTHIGGINWLMAALITGCSLLVVETFGADETMDLVARSGVTLAGVSTAFHLAYLAEQRSRPDARLLPVVRAFPGGAAPKPPALHYDLVDELGGVGIVSGFGMTEFPMITMGSIDDPTDRLARTEGRPSSGVELIVVGPDGATCAAGVDGELRARGPHRMLGYVDSALDAEAFDDDGYLRTGDIGHLDDLGHVVVTGRAKDVIVRKGENIAAQEIEHLLYEHPAVADVSVVGVPDHERGEMVCAVIVPASPSEPPSLVELVSYLRAKELMVQKLPERLELVDTLPRNAAGKVRKDELVRGLR